MLADEDVALSDHAAAKRCPLGGPDYLIQEVVTTTAPK